MSIKEQIKSISRGTAEIINVEALEKKLKSSKKKGKPLRIKAGFDPTAPDIHLGHVVLLKKLRQFQDLGHKVFFLIGDFTALVGDPTGQNQLRPKLDQKYITDNAKTYKKQVFKILDKEKTEVVFNSKWLGRLTTPKILELTAHSTVAQMLARSDFKQRFESNKEISLLEFLYPLLQGYDSVELKADVEFGGTDQKFNLLMGRQIQESFGQEPQVVIMTPLLEGTDGVQKMSKSLDNYIGISESPNEIFGKVMSIDDDLMYKYYEILTEVDLNEVKSMHPKEAKLKLAETIVNEFYTAKEANLAKQSFESTFSQGKVPEDIVKFRIDQAEEQTLTDILTKLKVVNTKNEVRRLLKQGAISHNGIKIDDEQWVLKEGVLKVGKRRFLKLI